MVATNNNERGETMTTTEKIRSMGVNELLNTFADCPELETEQDWDSGTTTIVFDDMAAVVDDTVQWVAND
jgi:hypothetical protein